MGEYPRARKHLEIANSLYDRWDRLTPGGGSIDPILHIDYGVHCRSYQAMTLWFLGYPGEALKKSNEALARAQSLSHPHTLAYAGFFAGRVRQLRRDGQATLEMEERLIALSAEHGFTFWLAQAIIELGAAIAELGDFEAGIARIREGLAKLPAAGPRPQYICLLARPALVRDACKRD
jgi:predicted ATPase